MQDNCWLNVGEHTGNFHWQNSTSTWGLGAKHTSEQPQCWLDLHKSVTQAESSFCSSIHRGDSNLPCKPLCLCHFLRRAPLPWAVIRAHCTQTGGLASMTSPEQPQTILAPCSGYCPMSFLLSSLFRACFSFSKPRARYCFKANLAGCRRHDAARGAAVELSAGIHVS